MSAPRFHEDEIARFNALASEWWNPEGPMKPLHRLNPVRMSFLRRTLADHFKRDERGKNPSQSTNPSQSMKPFEGLRLLDIGCAAGLVSEPLSRMGFTVSGIDLAEDNIAAAKLHAAEGGLTIDYAVRAIEDMPDDAGFDAITLLEVVEHVPDVGAMIAETAKRLRPGGILIASTLNRTLKAYAFAIVGAEYVLRWLPKGTHDWNKFVTPDELSDYMRDAGLMPLGAEGMTFNPLANSWNLSADCDVNYLIAAIKPE